MILFPGTLGFQRFESPSSLPPAVHARRFEVEPKVMRALGYNDGPFNIEFMHNPTIGAARPSRLTRAHRRRLQGRFAMTASCVPRTFENQYLRALPPRDAVETLERDFPELRVETLERFARWRRYLTFAFETVPPS